MKKLLFLSLILPACSSTSFSSSHGDELSVAGTTSTSLAAAGRDMGSSTGGTSAAGKPLVAAGGATTVGTATGGATMLGTGGSATGGTATGGTTSVGGAATGGKSSTGTGGAGTATGGTTPIGGAATGGKSPLGTGGAATGGLGVAGTAGSPPAPYPTMVLVNNAYWMDSTEVSWWQYKMWLATNPVPVQPPECSWNTDFTALYNNDLLLNRPVKGVDWCDAYAFCASAGRRLCGAISGGATAVADVNTITAEFYNACTSGGVSKVADGNLITDTTCNVSDKYPALTDVGANTTCSSLVPGYTGIYDLTGNVAEWTNSCDSAADTCAANGASSRRGVWTCNTTDYISRKLRDSTLGFRCCKSI
jgi:sulfatase modifying factor 1